MLRMALLVIWLRLLVLRGTAPILAERGYIIEFDAVRFHGCIASLDC